MSQDLYQAPDYYQLDELLTEEHLLVRDAAREWVKREVSPIIEEAAQQAKFPTSIIAGLAEIGAFGTLYSCRIWRCGIRPNFLRINNARN